MNHPHTSQPPSMPAAHTAPGCLQGVRVVDLTQVIAGPYCAMQLAQLGAQVLRVEALGGDPLRWRGGSSAALAAQGLSTHYQAHAAGRTQVMYLDWTQPEGVEQLRRHLEQADIFVCNLRAHVLPAMGLGDEALAAQYPQLVSCFISGYSASQNTAPCADWPAYDNTVQAASGLMRLSGAAPVGARVGAPVLDYATGMAALSGILAALLERQRSGRGQVVRVNMLAVAHQLMTAQRTDMALTGQEPAFKGNRANSGEPLSRIFETADGHLALAVNEAHQFSKLCHALASPQWVGDERFATRAARQAHAAALMESVQALLHTDSALNWEQRLNAHGVAAAAVRSLRESIQHPGAEAQPRLFRVQHGSVPDPLLHAPHSPPSHLASYS